MVNKDMNGFPVKKCSAFQFFKKRVRRWIKSPMVSVEKHPNASLKYPGSTVMHLPAGDSELEAPLCQTCLGDHSFQQGITPQEAESCSWESQPSSKAKEPHGRGEPLPRSETRPLWGSDDTGRGWAAHGGCGGLFCPQLRSGLWSFSQGQASLEGVFHAEMRCRLSPAVCLLDNSNNFCVGWLKHTMCCTRAPEELCCGIMRRNKSIIANPLDKPPAMLQHRPAVWAELSRAARQSPAGAWRPGPASEELHWFHKKEDSTTQAE
ncbi:uncharacterized protein [Anser cygnoides]|uniref:uncharacterized protein n=1 Tax=Anser cygnoides TaxID=8845 RepID=UPI0034D236CB